MSRQDAVRTKKRELFTDFDGKFDGVLARVIPVAATYTSELSVSAARYDCRVKIRYHKELMAQLEEGMLLAVDNFRGQSAKSREQGIKRYTVMVVSKVWPLHYGLGGVNDSHYYPLQMEIIEQACPDWSTDDQSTMMVHLDAIPINHDLIVDSSRDIEFKKGFSYPLVGSKVHVIHWDTVDAIYNDRVKREIDFVKNFTSPDPRKDPRIGVLRMFMESEHEIPIYVDLYKLVRYHFGVFSFTGGGKSNLMSNMIRRILYHTKDTKVVIFDISCEYPFLLCDVFADPHIKAKIILEEMPENAEQFALSTVRPRDFENDRCALEALQSIFNRKIVEYYNVARAEVPTYSSVLDDLNSLRSDVVDKPHYLNAIEHIRAFVLDEMTQNGKREKDLLDDGFIGRLQAKGIEAMKMFLVHDKSGLYAWATTRGQLIQMLRKAKDAPQTGITSEEIIEMLMGKERLICLSIAEPETIRDLVVDLTRNVLRYRKRRFEMRPQILFVFDEAQEFIPRDARGAFEHCVASVERLVRQGRKYGLGAAIATQRIAYLNTNVLQQLHTFFVGTLPRPYDRTVVSSSFQIDLGILDKTLEFPPGSWLMSSYIATGLDNVPIFVKADNAEDVLREHLRTFESQS